MREIFKGHPSFTVLTFSHISIKKIQRHIQGITGLLLCPIYSMILIWISSTSSVTILPHERVLPFSRGMTEACSSTPEESAI
jgi:hypothetical protein